MPLLGQVKRQRHVRAALHRLRHVQGLHLNRQRLKRSQHSGVNSHDFSLVG